ncbi:E3 ubiquitin-protein ligase RNF135-like [Gigantopelta aegis]|uniref:E3 ubiquitin-protein ligase RNF135-like n=1 Tax=Gigantopelta aegis TaxID=1735272 RepID=UPI001B88919D|nr:E3 ubiquitin-protein ligase RNF135-like [Gigantopelta aegis]
MASSCYTDNDEVSCSLCIEVFSDPRTIPCGHTFCRACLQNHFNSNRNPHSIYRCPVCRKLVFPDTTKPVSSYADQFPRNSALLHAIDTINKLKQHMASSCYTDNDEVSCSLCIEVFSDPRTIPCVHTFCRACLQNLFNSNKNPHSIYRCPVCRKLVFPDTTKPVSSYADQFPRNSALLHAIDTINKLKQPGAPATTTKTDHLKQNMKSICQNLEWFNQILQSQTKSEIQRLNNSVRISAVEITDEKEPEGRPNRDRCSRRTGQDEERDTTMPALHKQ